MDPETKQLVQSKIDRLQHGVEFGVKELMGEDWKNIASKQSFGRDFKKEVSEGGLTGAVHDRLENSPRHDVYLKTGQ